MLSVIVPTHNPRFLRSAVDSVLAQTLTDFELVIVPNGGVRLGGILPEDPRIRVVEYDGPPLVGAIKRFAFKAASGSLLVELDHDDLLAPQALQAIAQAFSDSETSFVYSNFAVFREETGEPVVYDAYYGWAYRDTEVLGRRVKEAIAFEPSPAALSYVWYAPHHVRAWRREAYLQTGGHDPAMAICDDHDLLIRTYLEGRMKRIDECLYLQREHSECTYLVHNAEIQEKTREFYARNVEKLVLAWARKAALPCYDLSEVQVPSPGWVTVEMGGNLMQFDLRGRWPWGDSSVGAFRALDFLPHLPEKRHTMAEIHRCLVPGGWLISATPSALGQGAFMNPSNLSYWVKNSFLYWTDASFATSIKNSTVKFQSMRLDEGFTSDWHRKEGIPYILFDGICLKEGYTGPGPRRF
jgi:hypothetical protein